MSDLWDYADVLWELEREQDAIDVVAVYSARPATVESVRSARLHALLLRRTFDEHDRTLGITIDGTKVRRRRIAILDVAKSKGRIRLMSASRARFWTRNTKRSTTTTPWSWHAS